MLDKIKLKKAKTIITNHLFGSLLLYYVFLFLIVLIRSVITGITYDEAYTYISFGRIDLFSYHTLRFLYGKANCIANNHWLNSILINIFNKLIAIEYNEFVIRLPILLFFVFYLIGVWYAYKHKYISIVTAIVLVSNYYLLEFYGLARGYGMANTCVYFACLSFIKWKNSQYKECKHLIWLMFYMSIASFSNTIALLLYPAFGLICLYRLICTGSLEKFIKKYGLLFFAFMLFTLLMIKYHLNISSEGKPLYTGGEQNFFNSVILGYVEMLIPYNNISYIIASISSFILIAGAIYLNKEIIYNDFSFMLIIFVATNLLMELVFHKGYIATRVLLPFYSFVVISFCELLSLILIKIKNEKIHNNYVLKIFKVSICLLFVTITIIQTNFMYTKDWKDDYRFKNWVLGEKLTNEKYPESSYWNAAEVFYQQKYENGITEYFSDIETTRNK